MVANKYSNAIITMCFALSITPLAWAQGTPTSGPTKEQTTEYVTSLLACETAYESNGVIVTAWSKAEDISFDPESSVLSWRNETNADKGNFRVRMVNSFSVPLKALDPNPTIVREPGKPPSLQYRCSEGKCGSHTSENATYRNQRLELAPPAATDAPDLVYFPECLADADRYARAVSHLIKLYGGKDALF